MFWESLALSWLTLLKLLMSGTGVFVTHGSFGELDILCVSLGKYKTIPQGFIEQPYYFCLSLFCTDVTTFPPFGTPFPISFPLTLCFSLPNFSLMVLYTFLVSVITPCYILTSEYLKLLTTGKRQYVSLSNLTWFSFSSSLIYLQTFLFHTSL